MPKRAAIALVVVFIVTRLISGWLAHSPDFYRGDTNVAGDVNFYHFYAARIMDGGEAPYRDVKIEYPPGSIVLIAAPYAISSDPETYRVLFIVEMILVDALGAVALLILARRWRSRWGVWAWVFLIPFLGPVVHVRLDLVPAVLTIWAFERASANRWLESGAAIGVGTAVKLYPIALLPILLILTWQRRQLLVGALLPVVASLLPYLGDLPELFDSVIGYQSGRGIQVESTWGLTLLVAAAFGLGVSVAYNFGAYHVRSSISSLFDTLATATSAFAAGAIYWLTYRNVKRGDLKTATLVSFALMSILLALNAVWSPQFLIWIIALAGVMLSAFGEEYRRIAYVLAGAGVASQIAYPFTYSDLLGANTFVAALLLARNLAVLALGVAVLMEVFPQLQPGRRIAVDA